MLYIYWKFSEAVNQQLGSILSVLDPCGADFGVLPLHFTVPSYDPLVQEVLDLYFGAIIEVETARKSDGNSFVKDLLSWWLSF